MAFNYTLSSDPGLYPAFIAVADFKTTLKAAEILHMSQPAVSDHISRLEESLGCTLFTRSRQGMALTDKGQLLYPYAKKILNLVSEAHYHVRASSEIAGVLSIAASSTIANYVLPWILPKFIRKYPEVKVDLASLNSSEVIEKVKSGQCNVGLTEGYSQSNQIHTMPFIEDELVLISHPKQQSVLSTIHDLKKRTLIWREEGSGTRETIEKALTDAGVDPDTLDSRLTMGSTEAIKQAIDHRLGWSFLSRWAVNTDVKKGRYSEIIMPQVEIKRWFYWANPLGSLDPLHKTFVRFANKAVLDLK